MLMVANPLTNHEWNRAVRDYLYRRNGYRLRLLVYAKERALFGKVTCFCCGAVIGTRNSSLEHIIAKSTGGELSLENLALSHKLCNSRRGNSNNPRYKPEVQAHAQHAQHCALL